MNLPFLKSGPSAPSSRHRRRGDGAGFVLERPGTSQGSWERWLLGPGDTARILQEGDSSPIAARMVILPTNRLQAWPLWIASEGDAAELVRMELSGRHLLRRGMESSLRVLPVEIVGERRLVLAVSPEEPFPSEGMPHHWEDAGTLSFQAAGWRGADLAVWLEWGSLHLAFFRNGNPVWFCDASEAGLPHTAFRSALRLMEEGVIAGLPRHILLAGLGESAARRVSDALTSSFPGSSVTSYPSELPPPEPRVWSAQPPDLPPAAATARRTGKTRREKLVNLAAVGAAIYALLLIWGSGDLLMRRMELRKLRAECSSLQGKADKARASSERWKGLRGAVDPSLFALDLLAVVAAPTEGGKIRLTRFSLERGRLQISAEATDVTQAYAFMERIRRSPELSAYDWTSGQPQLAGKNSVRFDMEGTNRDEKPGT
jgi:hypothetical protein